DRTHFIDGFADDIDDPSERGFSNRHRNGATRVFCWHTSNHSFGRLQCNGSYAAFTKMLLYFDDHIDRHRHIETHAGNMQGLMDRRLFSFIELNVNCWTDNL